MPLSMQAVDDRVNDLLIDPEHVRWSVEERIRWANESMGAILTRRPQALTVRTVKALVAGVLQSISDGASMLIDVVRNIAEDGVTSGSPIRRTDRQQIDDADPDWMTGTASKKIKQYTFDDRLPTAFYVYPPAVAGTKVEIMEAGVPAEIGDVADELAIGAEYLESVVNYVCYRCNSKDSEYSNAAVATMFYQAFEASLGAGVQTQVGSSPNQPGNSV